MDVRQQVIIFFCQQEAGEQRDLLVIHTVMRHACVRMVGRRIVEPAAQPIWIYFVAYPRQLWAKIAAHKIAGFILDRVAGRTERCAIKSSCFRRGIGAGWSSGGFDFNFRGRGGNALGHQESRNVSGVLIVQLKVRHGRRGRISLRILDPGIDPFTAGLFRDVRERRWIVAGRELIAIRLCDVVAVHAAHA